MKFNIFSIIQLGKLFYSDGGFYEGEFRDSKINGKGDFIIIIQNLSDKSSQKYLFILLSKANFSKAMEIHMKGSSKWGTLMAKVIVSSYHKTVCWLTIIGYLSKKMMIITFFFAFFKGKFIYAQGGIYEG